MIESYVRAWMRAFQVEMNVEDKLGSLPLLQRLVEEEAGETDDEFAIVKQLNSEDFRDLAKELGDTIWVCLYAMYVLGINPEKVMHSIYMSNMSKLDRDGQPILDEGGKIQKGPNYMPANLDWMLE